MVLEYVTGGLAVAAATFGSLAWLYRRGQSDGMDSACEKRIKDKIDLQGEKIDKMEGRSDERYSELGTKIDEVRGSVDVIKDLFTQHLTK